MVTSTGLALLDEPAEDASQADDGAGGGTAPSSRHRKARVSTPATGHTDPSDCGWEPANAQSSPAPKGEAHRELGHDHPGGQQAVGGSVRTAGR
jgi:hypothetical protein